VLFDADHDPPVVVDIGDYVRFLPVSERDYVDIRTRVQSGRYEIVTQSAGWPGM
jgi:inhibitor of KinA